LHNAGEVGALETPILPQLAMHDIWPTWNC